MPATADNTGYTASLRYAKIGYRRLRIARFRYTQSARCTKNAKIIKGMIFL